MYEITFVLNKKIDYKTRIKLCAEIIKIILEQKGVVTSLEYLGLQSLYLNRKVIKSQEKGKYVVIKAKTNPLTLEKVRYFFSQKDSVLRSLILKV